MMEAVETTAVDGSAMAEAKAPASSRESAVLNVATRTVVVGVVAVVVSVVDVGVSVASASGLLQPKRRQRRSVCMEGSISDLPLR